MGAPSFSHTGGNVFFGFVWWKMGYYSESPAPHPAPERPNRPLFRVPQTTFHAVSTSLSALRLPLLTAGAILLGVPIGRALRSQSADRPGFAKSAGTDSAASAQAKTGSNSNGAEVSDASVEAEITHLLGGDSQSPGQRTPAQIIDFISAAFQQKSDLRRFLAIYEAVAELGKDDIAGALERARSEDNAIAIRALERRWAEIDPVGATKAWAEGKGQPPGDAFFGAWAKSNPSGALRWYAALPDGDVKNQASASILDRIARADPQRALDFANQLPEGKDQNQLITRALAVLGSKDINAAKDAASALPDGPSRRAGLDSVVTQIASTNLEEAKRLAKELPANTLSGASSAIAAALAKQSPDIAVTWATDLPEGKSKESAFAGIAREWAARDVVAAATWLDTLPKGAARDSAVASFASRAAPRDPEGATAWASTLPAGEQRTSVLSQTLAIWQRINPSAASEWLSSAPGLSASERETLSQLPAQRFDPQRIRQFRERRAGN